MKTNHTPGGAIEGNGTMFDNPLSTEGDILPQRYQPPFVNTDLILKPYTFNDLIQEVATLENINSQTVREQARASIEARYKEAMKVLNENLVEVVAWVRENKTN